MTPPAPLYVLRLTDPHWETDTSLHRTREDVWAVVEDVCNDRGYYWGEYDAGYTQESAVEALRDRGWTVEIEEIACPGWLRVVS